MGGWFHGKQCFSMLLSWSFITNLQALGALLCAVQWTSSRMLSRWITLFGLSILWLAGADADNAGVVWVLGWPAWALARLTVHPQAWLDTLRHYQSGYWFWKVAVFAKKPSSDQPVTPAGLYVTGWDRVEGERRSLSQRDVQTGVGGRGREGTDGRLSVRCNDANNPRNSETLARRGRPGYTEKWAKTWAAVERELQYPTQVVLLYFI